jgi:hypothetical protein
MARTDIHRPSVIKSEDYVLVGFKYIGPDQFGGIGDDRVAIIQHMNAHGGKFSRHEHAGTCSICGANAYTLGVFWHPATNVYIQAGEDCAAKMDMGEDIAFRSFKKRVAAGLEAARGKAKAQKILADNNLSAAWDIAQGDADKWEENTIRDIVGKLVQYGSISDKQMAFVATLLAKIPAREADKAARAAANSGSQHIGTVGKREKFALQIEWIKTYDTNGFGTLYIHGLRDGAGNIVIYKGSKALGEKGQQILVLATVKAHDERDGVKQTVINRPARCAA